MGFKGKSISVVNYDAGNRLTAWNRAGADENHSQTWDYDDAGNWNSTTKDGNTESRTHSVSNQITQLDGKAVSHDLKGNLTEYEYDRTDYRVKYDLDNRIVEVKADSETIRYRYDALGRRIVSKGDDETVLIWWGDSECAEYEHRASKDAIQNDIMGHPTRLNSVIARDTEDRENRVELQWYHKNYLDHVYAVSDDNGNLVEHYRYTAFGEPEIYSTTGARRNTSAIGNTVMWNTRRYDADNGLYYYKYRHYAANMGRWLSRDPLGDEMFFAKETNKIIRLASSLGPVKTRDILLELKKESLDNLYKFCDNKPLRMWDKHGLGRKIKGPMLGHWGVIIDTWEYNEEKCCYKKTGAFRYDFTWKYQGGHWFFIPGALVLTAPGVVTKTPSGGSGNDASGPLQDIAAHANLAGLLPYGHAPAYNFVGNNCQHMALYFMASGMNKDPGKKCP